MAIPNGPAARGVRGVLRLLDGLAYATGIAAAIGVALIAVAMFSEILARNLLGVSLLFTWEYSSYLLSAVIFLGAANAARIDFHVRVGIAGELLSPGVARAVELLWLAVALVLAGYLFHSMLFLAAESIERGILAHTPTRTPLAYPYTINCIGAGMLVLQVAARIIRVALGLPTRPDDASEPKAGPP